MALVLKKPTPKEAPPAQAEAQAEAPKQSAPQKSAPQSTGMSFIKKGKAAAAAMEQEDAKAEERKKAASSGKAFRFYIPEGASTSITFLDGDLNDNILDVPFLYEHNVNMNGHWRNWFICTQDSEPCPICEGGGRNYYAGFLSVIDHSEWKDKQGVLHRDEVKMFVAKRDTLKQLLKLSAKRGGLRGCRFDVSRTGDKSPSVGNMFDFTEKYSEAQLKQMFGDKAKGIDFDTVLQEEYMDAKELRKLGFGSLNAPVGSEPGVKEDKDYSNDL